jgi:DNA-directed RNA polymerase subunit RPC12/RpoP
MKLGARGVPAFLIDGELIVGFDKNKIESMIDYKIINCPECDQKLRVPKNKGKIKVACKNCDTRFIVKT